MDTELYSSSHENVAPVRGNPALFGRRLVFVGWTYRPAGNHTGERDRNAFSFSRFFVFRPNEQRYRKDHRRPAGIQPGRDAPQKTPGRPVFWRHRNRHKGGLSGAERNLSQSKAAGERRAYRPCPPGQSRTAARGVRFHPPGQPGPGHFKKLCDDQGLRPGRYDRRLLRDLRAPRCRRSHAAGGNI